VHNKAKHYRFTCGSLNTPCKAAYLLLYIGNNTTAHVKSSMLNNVTLCTLLNHSHSCILCNLQVHYHVHKSLLCVPVLAQIQSMSLHPISLWHFNIILPSMPWYSEWSLSPPKSMCISLVPPYVPQAQPISFSFDHPNNIWLRVHVMKLLVM
jgi:hypothetical protein